MELEIFQKNLLSIDYVSIERRGQKWGKIWHIQRIFKKPYETAQVIKKSNRQQ